MITEILFNDDKSLLTWMLSDGSEACRKCNFVSAFVTSDSKAIVIIEPSSGNNLSVISSDGKEICRPDNPLSSNDLDTCFTGGGVMNGINYLYSAGLSKGGPTKVSVDIICKLNSETYEIYDVVQSR
ncbi:hypothetical protein [Shewanella denitrificans]|nr:hypothetical protein [Shewanella denitrificans]